MNGFRRFMQGRYGNDKLNRTILWLALGTFVGSLFVPLPSARRLMMLGYYGLLAIAIFRMLSRNTYRRYQENRRYLRLLERIRDREHRYYDCPRCHQPVRVPRGKGKISIRCPRCGEKFIRKT